MSLTDIDLRILDLLSSQRVLTSPQLAALSPETPARTLRYRCNRLAGLGLLGRTRPYRERGSAPHHLWPTRKGEAVISGEPQPRGGERREPNPLFLAHAVGLSEIYVALKTALPAEVQLTDFEREADAREAFETPIKREDRAIAPDVFIEISAADGRDLLAFVELDMGTMSHRQLKKKAAGYAAYARASAWRERHRFCPALLFITTTEKRARSFLNMMRKELGRDALLLTCVCDLARGLRRCPTEARWRMSIDEGKQAVDLLAALHEARRPYDEELAREEAERRKEEAERERLRSDPEALRSHLRTWSQRSGSATHSGRPLGAALDIMLERTGALDEVERDALMALGTMLADPIQVRFAERDPTAEERRSLNALLNHRRALQREHVDRLTGRFGDGPALRQVRKRIAANELLHDHELDALTEKAESNCKARAEQERLKEGYLRWRDEEAKRLAKAQGFIARLRNGRETFFGEVDRRALRHCKGCEETAYPDPERAESYDKRNVAQCCHYCGGGFPGVDSAARDQVEPWSRW